MARFEIGKDYKGKTFLGYDFNVTCVGRTSRTVKLVDKDSKDVYVKKIKSASSGEYVTFSKDFMGYCEMDIKA